MTASADKPDVLVIDGGGVARESYVPLLSDLVGDILVADPRAAMARLAGGGRFGAILVHVDGLDAAAREALLIGAIGAVDAGQPVPLLLIASDAAALSEIASRVPGLYDVLAAPVAPALLRAKLRLIGELHRTRTALARAEAEVSRLSEQASAQVHRTKNLLAIVQSIALRSVIDGREIGLAREALVGRLKALSRAYQLVVSAGGQGADLGDLIEAELGDLAHRVTASGPPVRLGGGAVQTLTLAVHELADNAVRHGVLRARDGSVAVGWTYFERGPDRYLEIAWTERGAAAVSPPQQYGFGLALVSSLAGGGPVPNVRFEEDGFHCRLRVGHDAILSP